MIALQILQGPVRMASSSIPVPFLEKHLVISVWWNYCAEPFIDLGCKTSRLPICNNKPPSAAQPLQAQQRPQCKKDFCFVRVELSEAWIKRQRGNVRVKYLHLSILHIHFLSNHRHVKHVGGEKAFSFIFKEQNMPARYSFIAEQARDDNKTRQSIIKVTFFSLATKQLPAFLQLRSTLMARGLEPTPFLACRSQSITSTASSVWSQFDPAILDLAGLRHNPSKVPIHLPENILFSRKAT